MRNRELICRTAEGPAAGAVIDANAESLVIDCSDLEHVEAYAIQVTDGGTVTLALERSPDGTTFVALGAAIAESDFPAGAGTAVARAAEGTNGMALPVKQIRLRSTAYGAGGTYALKVCGYQREGYR